MKVPTFSASEKAQIIELVADNPLYLSKLLNHQLPQELHDLCSQKNIPLFPRSWNEFTGGCSCPDWAVPCKHMAAVFYLVANEIDKNPFLVFELRGFDLYKGLEGVGFSAAGYSQVAITNVADLRRPFDVESPNFEWSEERLRTLDFSKLPDCQESLFQLLSDNSVFYGNGNFKGVLKRVYKNVARALVKQSKGIIEKQEVTKAMTATEEIEIILEEDFDFVKCSLRDSRGKLVNNFSTEEALIAWLSDVPIEKLAQFSTHLKSLYIAYRFATKLAEKNAYLPQLVRVGLKHYKVRWLPALLNKEIQAVYQTVAETLAPNLVYYKINKAIYQPKLGEELSALLSFFLTHFVQAHHHLGAKFDEDSIADLFFKGYLSSFNQFENKEYPTAIQLWLNKFFISEKDYVPVLKIEDIDPDFKVELAIEDTTQPMTAPIP